MTARQVKIRDGVKTALAATDFTAYFATTTFEATYFPQENLEDLSAAPKIKIVGMNIVSDRNRELRNPNALLLEVPVQICVQMQVDPTATSVIDNLVEFCEAVMAVCEDDELVSGENYNYMRTEPLKDENGLEFPYESLYASGIFQCIFTVYYTTIKES